MLLKEDTKRLEIEYFGLPMRIGFFDVTSRLCGEWR